MDTDTQDFTENTKELFEQANEGAEELIGGDIFSDEAVTKVTELYERALRFKTLEEILEALQEGIYSNESE